jgi:hypothetical protein
MKIQVCMRNLGRQESEIVNISDELSALYALTYSSLSSQAGLSFPGLRRLKSLSMKWFREVRIHVDGSVIVEKRARCIPDIIMDWIVQACEKKTPRLCGLLLSLIVSFIYGSLNLKYYCSWYSKRKRLRLLGSVARCVRLAVLKRCAIRTCPKVPKNKTYLIKYVICHYKGVRAAMQGPSYVLLSCASFTFQIFDNTCPSIYYLTQLRHGASGLSLASLLQPPWDGHLLTSWQAVRIQYDLKTETLADLGDVIRAAIFLGQGQVDLAVEPHGIDRVNQHFTNLNHLRLLRHDPLFLSEDNRFCVRTAHAALANMRQKYCDETNNMLLLWDRRLAEWFAAAITRFDELIIHYQLRC